LTSCGYVSSAEEMPFILGSLTNEVAHHIGIMVIKGIRKVDYGKIE
jgi:hypothetical protein